MSRFIDKLKQASQVISQPMGFRAAQPISKLRLLLIACLPQTGVDNLVDYIAGADAGLLPIAGLSSGAKKLKEIVRVVPGIPWGGLLKDNCRGGIKQLVQADCDFIAFPANTSLKLLADDKVGKVLVVAPSLDEGLLRAVDELPADAVFITSKQQGEHFLTWHHLMSFKRFSDLLTKPLLVSVPANVTADELQTLWEVGVDGVVVDVEIGQPAGRLRELRQMIDSLVLSSKHKRAKIAALLPRVRGEAGMLITEEEEEEEEEE